METIENTPQTLTQAVRYFSDPDVCLAYMVPVRWPVGVVTCPTCGRSDPRFLASRRVWQCKALHDHRQFSIKIGTIFENSPLGLDKWLPAVWMLANCKNGISSYEVARALGVTQKTAWFMLHRIRLAMTPTTDEFRAFDRLMRKLITVPKKALDKKVAAFKRRKKKPH